MQSVTMKNIAEKAGVSVSTVSFCLNNTGRVGEETRKKVLKIANDLNYIPNLAARELAGKKSTIIGVVIPDCADLKNAPLLRGIDNSLEVNDYYSFICFTHNKADRERAYINLLKGKNVDGLIIFPCVNSNTSQNIDLLWNMIEKDIPIVFVDTYLEQLECPYVITDNYQAAYQGTKFLIKNGHQRIAYIGGLYHIVGCDRFRGYKDAMEEAGIFDENLVYTNCEFNDSETEIAQKIKNIFSNKDLTGVMAFNYNSTLAVINTIKSNVNIDAKNIEVVGFDYLLPIQEYGLAVYTYNQPHFEMGEKAVQILMNKINNGNKKDNPYKIKLTAELQPVSLEAVNKGKS